MKRNQSTHRRIKSKCLSLKVFDISWCVVNVSLRGLDLLGIQCSETLFGTGQHFIKPQFKGAQI